VTEQPAPSGDESASATLPAVLTHLVAVCRAKLNGNGTIEVQPGANRYVITVCRGHKDLVMMFVRRHRQWRLTAAGVVIDGQPQGVRVRTVTEAIQLLGGHGPGTGRTSSVRAARIPRDSALDAKKNTVLRV
jgi:hypothetical protein